MTAMTDENGNRTQYVLDGNGNIVESIDALGTSAKFTYDKVGNLSKVDLHRIDSQDKVDEHEITLYSYDGRGLVTTVIDAENNQIRYQYDGNGWSNAAAFSSSDITGANVFTSGSSFEETLNAVSFYTITDNQKYTVKIYKNLTGDTPDTGTLASSCTVSGTADYSGYHTVKLPTSCTLTPGSKFAVTITYKYDYIAFATIFSSLF